MELCTVVISSCAYNGLITSFLALCGTMAYKLVEFTTLFKCAENRLVTAFKNNVFKLLYDSPIYFDLPLIVPFLK